MKRNALGFMVTESIFDACSLTKDNQPVVGKSAFYLGNKQSECKSAQRRNITKLCMCIVDIKLSS